MHALRPPPMLLTSPLLCVSVVVNIKICKLAAVNNSFSLIADYAFDKKV